VPNENGRPDVPFIRDTILPIMHERMAACASSEKLALTASSTSELQAAIANIVAIVSTQVARLSH
jgi:hypothetical protein